MKKIYTLITVVATVAAALCLVSCNEDSIKCESVITADQQEYTDFDYWLDANYVAPYNIKFKYRYEEILANYSYYTVPAEYQLAVEMAHIVKHVCLEAYDEVAGVDFTRKNFPKQIVCTGEWLYQNNGTIILGSAEGGRQINLEGLNYLAQYKKSASELNHYYLKTIHHEFTHILNQNIAYATSFQFITGTEYVGGVWNESPYSSPSYYLAHGFISDYAQQEAGEDYAEMLSLYVTNTEAQWQRWLTQATQYTIAYNNDNGTSLADGAQLITAKLDEVRAYMSQSWGIDIDELRAAIQRRQQEIFDGKVDLDDLSVDGRELPLDNNQ